MMRNGQQSQGDPGAITAVCSPPWLVPEALRPNGRALRSRGAPGTCRLDDESTTLSAVYPSDQRPGESHRSPEEDPADRWWLRTGLALVGPVTSTRLLLGIVTGRVPEDCEVLCLREPTWRPLASTAPFAEALRNRSGEDPEASGDRCASLPPAPPAPCRAGAAPGFVMEADARAHLTPQPPQVPAIRWDAIGSPMTESPSASQPIEPQELELESRRLAGLRLLLWTILLGCAFGLGTVFGHTEQGLYLRRILRPPATESSANSRAKVVASPSRPDARPKTQSTNINSERTTLVENKPPNQRTLAEAMVLGRHRLQQRERQLEVLREQVEHRPGLLTDKDTRAKLAAFIEDQSTSLEALGLLARVATPEALDMLYQAWIGSRQRTETTRMAEALLLTSDVRSRAAPALALALALRDRPSECQEIRQLVDTALQHGDRRSAMLLVRTAGRKDCDDGRSVTACIRCVDSPNKMRTAIRVAASRPGPAL